MDESDHDLIRQAQGGAAEAFAALARRHRPALVRCCALLIGDADEAESLAQEALTRAYAQLPEFVAGASFPAWVRGIALNLCRGWLRQRGRHARPLPPEQLSEALDPEGRRQGVLSGILRDELHGRLWQAVGLLPMPFREALVLHYVEGLDYATMSELTGVSAGNLRARALRARKLLRESLGQAVDTWLRTGDDEPVA
jgi:RNA polymerase sigma-70 factor (ECF subfamily)